MADYQKLINEFEAEQITVFAGSVDPKEKAKETVEKLGISFHVAYGLDAEEVTGITGGYFDQSKKYLQPSCFLIRPDNTLEVVCYSSGPIGRFAASNVLSLARYYKSETKKKTK